MNQGYVAKQNMGGSEKSFMNNSCNYKVLPKADGLKEFRAPSSSDKSVIDRDHSAVTYKKTTPHSI